MYSSFLEEDIVFDQSVSGKAIVNSDCEGQICYPSLDRESSQKREDSLPKIRIPNVHMPTKRRLGEHFRRRSVERTLRAQGKGGLSERSSSLETRMQ